jgi:hypothetical protein
MRLEHLHGPHLELFRDYVVDMRRAIQGAHAWWNALIETEARRCGNLTEAEYRVKRRNAVGRFANRGVIGVLRKYWLACEAINGQSAVGSRVPPEQFMLGMLIDTTWEDIAEFLSHLPYWPIGMSPKGEWI